MSGRIERIVVPFDATSEKRVAVVIAAYPAADPRRSGTVSLSRTRLRRIWWICPLPGGPTATA